MPSTNDLPFTFKTWWCKTCQHPSLLTCVSSCMMRCTSWRVPVQFRTRPSERLSIAIFNICDISKVNNVHSWWRIPQWTEVSITLLMKEPSDDGFNREIDDNIPKWMWANLSGTLSWTLLHPYLPGAMSLFSSLSGMLLTSLWGGMIWFSPSSIMPSLPDRDNYFKSVA